MLKNLQSQKNSKLGFKTILVAELSANHAGDLDVAKRSIVVAAKAGVDAVKIQTLTPGGITMQASSSDFVVSKGLWKGANLYDLYQQAMMPWDWFGELQSVANSNGIALFSSPFEPAAVDYLIQQNVPALKIASAEAMDFEFVEYCAKSGVPLIISSGMSTEEELQHTVKVVKKYHENVVILHCVAEYPAAIEDMHINSVTAIKDRLKVSVGLSDHSKSDFASMAAVAQGCLLIEKHFTILGRDETLDGEFSLNPDELASWVKNVRKIEATLGIGHVGIATDAIEHKIYRRSLYYSKDLKTGQIITEDDVRSIRPAFGIHPKYKSDIIGRKLVKDVSRATAIKFEDLA